MKFSWDYRDGTEGGIVEVENNIITDYDGASTLPIYILKELDNKGYAFEQFEDEDSKEVFRDGNIVVLDTGAVFDVNFINCYIKSFHTLDHAKNFVQDIKKIKTANLLEKI